MPLRGAPQSVAGARAREMSSLQIGSRGKPRLWERGLRTGLGSYGKPRLWERGLRRPLLLHPVPTRCWGPTGSCACPRADESRALGRLLRLRGRQRPGPLSVRGAPPLFHAHATAAAAIGWGRSEKALWGGGWVRTRLPAAGVSR